jgi:hypothetical protein
LGRKIGQTHGREADFSSPRMFPSWKYQTITNKERKKARKQDRNNKEEKIERKKNRKDRKKVWR